MSDPTIGGDPNYRPDPTQPLPSADVPTEAMNEAPTAPTEQIVADDAVGGAGLAVPPNAPVARPVRGGPPGWLPWVIVLLVAGIAVVLALTVLPLLNPTPATTGTPTPLPTVSVAPTPTEDTGDGESTEPAPPPPPAPEPTETTEPEPEPTETTEPEPTETPAP